MTRRTVEGRVALVTGANRGIGLSIAEELAREGAVVYGGARTPEGVAVIDRMFSENDLEGHGVELDVTQTESLRERVKTIAEMAGKPVSILVNNAGITRDGPAVGMKENWDDVIATNLTGTFRTTQAALLPMVKAVRRGEIAEADIVNIASVVGVVGEAMQVNYAASKGGIIAMTRSWAKEVPEVNFNVINPGYVETDMTSVLDEEHRQAILDLTETGEPLQPIEIARCVIHVIQKGRTGQVIDYDDGIIEKLTSLEGLKFSESS